jgi:hypothetical protein
VGEGWEEKEHPLKGGEHVVPLYLRRSRALVVQDVPEPAGTRVEEMETFRERRDGLDEGHTCMGDKQETMDKTQPSADSSFLRGPRNGGTVLAAVWSWRSRLRVGHCGRGGE